MLIWASLKLPMCSARRYLSKEAELATLSWQLRLCFLNLLLLQATHYAGIFFCQRLCLVARNRFSKDVE